CGIANTEISVSSDEPVQTREKDDQSPDWQIVDNNHIRLRAERSQIGNGRTYTIKVTTADVNGNLNSATATVNVPNSPGHTDCKFIVTAAPNPSRNYFLVKINSSCWDKINLRLLNNRGSVLKIISNMNPLAVLKIGDNLIPGVYYLEATQSGVTKTLKLIKQ
ncbi:MAG TPA: T9SS type A sorting domain-containing protein, partial [Chitinophagaceae bacterium]|nr:T9SS type A sorting domain-containing protein [Chitinophagaceae bacterium]